MSSVVLPFTLPGCVVDEIRVTGPTLMIIAHGDELSVQCPDCQHPSRRVHSRYTRCPQDLPVSDQAVQLVLQVRRFFCDNPECPCRTFAERFPALVAVRARRTARLSRTLQALALTLGGEAGARLLKL